MDKAAVEKVAHLARLKLNSQEIDEISAQLSAVLENFQELAKIDTSGVLPLINPTDMAITLRPDRAEKPESDHAAPEKMLAVAPARSGSLFKVPPVV